MTPILFSATTKPEEAKDFYTQVLDFKLVSDSPFSLEFDAAGTTLRVQKVPAFTPLPFTLLGWRVDDIAGRVDELAARGAVFERYEFMEQDDRGIWHTPDGAKVAWFKDPDGNTLSLTEFG